MDILEAEGIPIPSLVRDADILTQFAIQTRYPGWIEPVTEQEYQDTLTLAQAVVSWADSLISLYSNHQ